MSDTDDSRDFRGAEVEMLRKRVRELEAENARLEVQLAELRLKVALTLTRESEAPF